MVSLTDIIRKGSIRIPGFDFDRLLNEGSEHTDFASANEAPLPVSSPSPPSHGGKRRLLSDSSADEVASRAIVNNSRVKGSNDGDRGEESIVISEDDSPSGGTAAVWKVHRGPRRPTKVRKVKRSPAKFSSSPHHCEEVGGPSIWKRLPDLPTSEVATRARLWLDDIEEIRSRSSNLQGAFNRKLKDRIAVLVSCIDILSRRSEEAGSLDYLHVRNSDLESQVRSQAREVSRLKEDLDNSEMKVRELNSEIRALRDRIGSSGTSSVEQRGTSPKKGKVADRNSSVRHQKSSSVDVDAMTDRILGIVNEGLDRRMKTFQVYEDRIVNLMEDLVGMRAGLVEWRDNFSPAPSVIGGSSVQGDSSRFKLGKGGQPKALPKIISNVQVVPPRDVIPRSEERIPLEMVEVEMEDLVVVDGGPNNWKKVTSRREKRQKGSESKLRPEPLELAGNREVPVTPRTYGGRTPVKRDGPRSIGGRIPKVAAVSIKSADDSVSYAEILKKARSSFSLTDLGIGSSRICEAANGGILIEVLDPDGGSKADMLVSRLEKVLGKSIDSVAISRPVKMGR